MSSQSLKMLPINYSFTNHKITHIYDLALDNLQGLICPKTQPINNKNLN